MPSLSDPVRFPAASPGLDRLGNLFICGAGVHADDRSDLAYYLLWCHTVTILASILILRPLTCAASRAARTALPYPLATTGMKILWILRPYFTEKITIQSVTAASL